VKLVDCLDIGATLVPTAPCLVTETSVLSYAEVQGLSRSIAASLTACGVGPGSTVAVLSATDPLALTCILAASRAGASWMLVDPADVTAEELLQELGGCSVLLFRTTSADLAQQVNPSLPQPHTLVCLDGHHDGAVSWGEFLVAGAALAAVGPVGPVGHALPAPARPVDDRPALLALGPLTESTAARWQRVLARGGRIVMRPAEAALAARARLEA
jgi:acyl-CoA synthetase (AMP-forming)/AMP-acid ligase II